MTTRRALAGLILAAAIAAVPAHAQFFGGGGKSYDRASWSLCNGGPCAVQPDVTVPFIVVAASTAEKCYIAAKTAPTGAALIVDVKKNGVSIYQASKFQLPAGQTTATITTFASAAAASLAESDLLSLDITQVGSIVAGQDVAVTCRIKVK